jgi:hypothetical protein
LSGEQGVGLEQTFRYYRRHGERSGHLRLPS